MIQIRKFYVADTCNHLKGGLPTQSTKDIYLNGKIIIGYEKTTKPGGYCFDEQYLCPSPHPFKDDQDVTGLYELEYQIRSFGNMDWDECTVKQYERFEDFPNQRRIIAIPAVPTVVEGEKEEKIMCAAIWYKDMPDAVIQVSGVDRGVVMCGYRHGYIIHQFVALTGKRSVTSEAGEYVQGFLTTINRFVDRKEAMTIAKKSGQVTSYQSFEELYSEDLY